MIVKNATDIANTNDALTNETNLQIIEKTK